MERARTLYDDARLIVYALGAEMTPEARARMLWAAQHGEPVTVSVTRTAPPEVALWLGAELLASVREGQL